MPHYQLACCKKRIVADGRFLESRLRPTVVAASALCFHEHPPAHFMRALPRHLGHLPIRFARAIPSRLFSHPSRLSDAHPTRGIVCRSCDARKARHDLHQKLAWRVLSEIVLSITKMTDERVNFETCASK
ncbi:hypothetical protein BD310DRAFT_939916 [Dichomitus squalens]|uniref:Uncharacterized protein n=1 Tax=Dichomitus squalens TaxID=114155 RepID=A0A4Q9PGU6_9APHY|nr:hypothetical protein BD310DRAFT_939916 [Dichomitus squalens]